MDRTAEPTPFVSVTPVRLVHAALALLLAGALLATYTGAALTWDGASLLFAFLDIQDLTLPHHRYAVGLLQLPTLVASRFTEDVRVLELLYGLTYTLLPFLFALASFRIVRPVHPRLVVWQVLWIAVGAYPGQMFFVTESLIAVHVAWPLLLIVLTGFTRFRVVACALLAAFLFELHPVAGPLLVLCAVTAFACGLRNAYRRRELFIAAALLAAVGLARVWVSLHDDYELSQATVRFGSIWKTLKLPHLSLAGAGIVVVALAVAHQLRPTRSSPLHGIAAAGVVVYFVSLVPWALDLHAWEDALNYRFVVPFAAPPFLVAAGVGTLTTLPRDTRLTRGDAGLALAATLAFSVLLGIQCVKWFGLRKALVTSFALSRPCVTMSAIPACRTTALKWWTTPSYAILVQGHTPRSLVLSGNYCSQRDLPRVVHVNPWYTRDRHVGWFDLRRAGLP